MAKPYQTLEPKLKEFIERQKIFFTASATDSSRVNVSPRSTDCLRITDDNTAIYLDKTGSGNETAAHLLADGRMTIMMCAFEHPPQIMRLYGRGHVIHRDSAEYADLVTTWFATERAHAARQIVQLDFDLVQTSCGLAVPFFDYQGERDTLNRWAETKTRNEIADYWREKNQVSMDGLPTGIFKEPE